MSKQASGYTLIELLITIALISILTLVAVPSFRGPTMKARQVSAKTALFELAIALEHYRQEHLSYADFEWHEQPKLTSYQLKIISKTQDKFLIAAIPKQEHPDDNCGIFYLDQDSNKTSSGIGKDCW